MTPPAGLQPDIPEALLLWLERLYPDKMPYHLDDARAIAYLAGQVSVIRSLRAIYNRQNGGDNVTKV